MSASDHLGPQFSVATWPKSEYPTNNTTVGPDIGPKEEHVYMNGQCHSLAQSIFKKYGHPVGYVFGLGKGSSSEKHYFNYDKTDKTQGFDIKGRRPVENIVKDLYGYGHLDFHNAPKKFEARIAKKTLLPMNQEAADHFAEKIIKRVNK